MTIIIPTTVIAGFLVYPEILFIISWPQGSRGRYSSMWYFLEITLESDILVCDISKITLEGVILVCNICQIIL